MPTIVKIEADPNYKPATDEDAKQFAVAKAQGVIEVDHTIAMDNIRISGGLYRLKPQIATDEGAPRPRPLEDHTVDELKLMLVQLGIKPEKGVKKAEVIALIRAQMDEIDIADE